MDSEIRQALEKTLERFENGKWCKGTMHDHYGNYCLVGSLQTELAGGDVEVATYKAVKELGFQNVESAICFNDSVNTTRSSVIVLIEKALAKDVPDVVPSLLLLLLPLRRQLAKV